MFDLGMNAKDIGAYLKGRLESYESKPVVYEYGTVAYAGDGVVRIDGLARCHYGELVALDNDVYGMAMDLDENGAGVVLLNGVNEVQVGTRVRGTGNVVEVPVGNELLGRVVNPIGVPLDGRPLRAKEFLPVERIAPHIIDRQKVSEPLETGILAIDSVIPIGKGQRELIIGDRQTGKSTIALDTVLNQKGKNVVCVYVAIGQKVSTVTRLYETLLEFGAMEYTVVVSASASDCAAMQYIAPYAGCSIAESFMEKGMDALIIYDDLSKHAVAYRAMSLLLKRPPGREAYPGDVFYLHSRLLERSAHLSAALGGGSLTALPIVETMSNDISAYIPTNVISITDGQIYLETELFHSGVRPAVNVGLSVSRVGGSAQRKAMRKVSSKLRLMLAQYRELIIFSQFGADIDSVTKKVIDKGAHLQETLKQNQSSPYKMSEQVCLLMASMGDYQSEVPLNRIRDYNAGLLQRLRSVCAAQLNELEASGSFGNETQEILLKAITDYTKGFKAV